MAASLLKSGGANVFLVKKDSSAQLSSLLLALEKSDGGGADLLKKRQLENQNILKQLESSRTEMSEQRKAAAAEKVQRIKQKLQMLRLLASINPKAAAKQAAQLSRELAQAVREYSGGDTTTSLTQPAANAGAAVTSVSAQTADSEDMDGTGSVAMPVVATADQTAQDGEQMAEEGGETSAQKDAVMAANPSAARQSLEDIAKNKEDEENAFRAHIQEKIAASSESMAKTRADSEFSKEVEDVKNTLRNILNMVKKKFEEKNDSAADHDIREAENALYEAKVSVNTNAVASAVNIVL